MREKINSIFKKKRGWMLFALITSFAPLSARYAQVQQRQRTYPQRQPAPRQYAQNQRPQEYAQNQRPQQKVDPVDSKEEKRFFTASVLRIFGSQMDKFSFDGSTLSIVSNGSNFETKMEWKREDIQSVRVAYFFQSFAGKLCIAFYSVFTALALCYRDDFSNFGSGEDFLFCIFPFVISSLVLLPLLTGYSVEIRGYYGNVLYKKNFFDVIYYTKFLNFAEVVNNTLPGRGK